MTKAEARSCLAAARRKCLIVKYHLNCLMEYLKEFPDSDPRWPGMPRICIQAHFEGVLFSTDAAKDQVMTAIGGRKCPQQFEEWTAQELMRDVTCLRNKATHLSYDKLQSPPDCWRVQPVGTNYEPRDLLGYSKAVVLCLEDLERIIPAISRYLGCGD
jgi:hypothetical protein